MSRRAARRKIVISDESDGLLDSAGGIVKALPELGGEPFYILNADTFWIDRGRLQSRAPRPCMGRGADGYSADARRSRLMRPDTAAAPTSSRRRTAACARSNGDPDGLIYAGAAIVDPRIFAGAPAGPHSLNLYFDTAIAAGRLFGMKMDGHWITVGTPDAIPLAEAAVAARAART